LAPADRPQPNSAAIEPMLTFLASWWAQAGMKNRHLTYAPLCGHEPGHRRRLTSEGMPSYPPATTLKTEMGSGRAEEGNPVWMLLTAHFGPCEIIYQHYQKTKPHFFNPQTQEKFGEQFMAYTHLWIALLYVVADGFKELGLSDPNISPIIDSHLQEMKVFRNSVFHFQKDDRKRIQFTEWTSSMGRATAHRLSEIFHLAKRLGHSLSNSERACDNRPQRDTVDYWTL
jgi:hypothetical protein